METPSFHDEISLAETAESLAKQALDRGLIPSFVVRHFPDSKQFYIPNETTSEALTPEEAFLKLKRMIDAGQ